VNAISVQQLGKKFKLFSSPGSRFLEYMSAGRLTRHTDFWALQDITFEIPAGTTLGILGQNGSGKSTLLSILAGVLEPSAGTFAINGKVSAILELGSGFHPEFSGRDNVYMYGSIMGLSKDDVDERFSEIVRFSELGDFIDQPLRTYSSGMIVRLAFSVAVNVNADILIVDEALAVGDAIFQHRCFRKIREMQEAGKTILYVGHDTEAVRNLCTSALLLDAGRVIGRGDSNMVVNRYHALITERERAYPEGNLIEHGMVPGEEYETVYDFVRNLHEAKIESAREIPVQAQTVEIQSVPRYVIFAHPPSQITYLVSVEPRASLAFAIGILPAAWENIPLGVKFDIDVIADGRTESLFSRVLIPKRNIGDRGWHNFILPLEKYSGETVSLVFSTSGSGEDLSYCWSAWGWGKIVKPIEVNKHLSQFKCGDININNSSEDQMSDSMKSRVRIGNKKAVITNTQLTDIDGFERLVFQTGERIIIKIHVLFNQDIEKNFSVGFHIKGRYCDIFGTNNQLNDIQVKPKRKGDRITVIFSLPINLAKGIYSIRVGCTIIHSEEDIEVLDRYYDYVYFTVLSAKKFVGIVDIDTKVTIIDR
jgi:ABC-type polysaccharide/polyol phosphate transport system ATPase subunit